MKEKSVNYCAEHIMPTLNEPKAHKKTCIFSSEEIGLPGFLSNWDANLVLVWSTRLVLQQTNTVSAFEGFTIH